LLLLEFGHFFLQGVDSGCQILQGIGPGQAGAACKHCREGEWQLAWSKKVSWVLVHRFPFEGVAQFRLALVDRSSNRQTPAGPGLAQHC
jgi:hypothetical protein